MKKDEIIKYLANRSKHRITNKFKDNSVKELCDFMEFFKSNFKTKKGNWSIRKLSDFKQRYKLDNRFDYNISDFYEQYSKRKKQNKSFQNFITKTEHKQNKRREKYFKSLYRNNSLLLIEKDKIKDFLNDIKLIKHKYLKGDDGKLISMISRNIKTGLSESTIRNYYYNND